MSNTNAVRTSALTGSTDTTASRTTRRAATAHLWLNRAVLGGIAVQFYTVALHALGVNGLAAHAVLGWTMIAVAALSLGAVRVSQASNARLAIPAAVLALTITQALLANVSRSAFPLIYALHGANAILVLVLAYRAERLAVRARRSLA